MKENSWTYSALLAKMNQHIRAETTMNIQDWIFGADGAGAMDVDVQKGSEKQGPQHGKSSGRQSRRRN